MKKMTFVTALMLILASVSCVKTEKKTTHTDLPKIKKYERLEVKKSGYKCDLVSDIENKEIFIHLEKKNEKTLASFYDFVSATKITKIFASLGEISLFSFELSKVQDDNKTLSGESMLIHSNRESLSDEGKILAVRGKLTLNEDMSGSLEQVLSIQTEDNQIKKTEPKEIAKIENCEVFEAIWF